MLRVVVAMTLLLACKPSSPASTAEPSGRGSARAPLVLRETGIAPIDGTTKVTDAVIRPLFPGYDVKSAYPPGLDEKHNLGPPDVQVSADGELQLIIVSNDAGMLMGVHVTSAKVTSEAGWRVGDKVTDTSKFGGCECVGEGLVCFAKKSHIGAVLDDDCMRRIDHAAMAGESPSAADLGIEAGDPAALAKLKGHSIRTLRWMPRTFDDPARRDEMPPPPPE